MTKTHTLAVLAAGTFALAGLGTPAHAQYRTPPAQSLGDSCRDIQTLNSGYVTAVCRDTQGRYRWSSIYYPYCRSDVSNRDGVLACLGAEATVGGYVEQPRPSETSPVGELLGAIAGAILGGGDDQPLYGPGARYPTWGQPGYGDPRYDPRFGQQGWGYGARGWVPIARRQAWLERRIDLGRRQGSLTQAEALSLRAELTRLERLELRYRRNGLTNAERADLDRRFDILAARIRAERRDDDTRWTGINQRQAELDTRIDAGVRDGTLTRSEAARLRDDFDALARLEADYRRDGLTNAERADLDRRFDQLSARIQADRRDDETRWTSIDQRQADLDARIDAGVRDGTLTRSEAARLRDDFDALARLEADYRRDGLTNAERADLDRRFDQLSARIQADRRDDETRWTSIDQRQADLDARIDAGVRDGTLTRSEAARLRDDFDALARLEADYRRDGLTNAERADLDRRFDQLSAQIRADRQDDQDRWTSINERQAALDARIDAGVRDGTLTRSEAMQLRADFDALARLEADYRRDGLTNAERTDLDRRFDQLSARIRADRRDR